MSEQQPSFSIEKIYLKDASIEAPNTPQVFLESGQPQVDVALQTTGGRAAESLYEVVVTATVTAKTGERTYFLVEAAQAGIFQIRNVPESDIEAILAVACANIIFPYLRESVADLVGRAGFPPIHLAPVNFEAMYAERARTQQESGPRIEIAH